MAWKEAEERGENMEHRIYNRAKCSIVELLFSVNVNVLLNVFAKSKTTLRRQCS
jgi:hypothetical protein